jgi:catalase
MTPKPSRPALPPHLPAFVAIGLVVGSTAGAFAYTAGWLSPDRLTPARIVDALSARGGDPIGHRRNHAKGICFTGELDSDGDGVTLSTARVFEAGRYPVIGRFAIATGNPLAADASGRVRSMAIQVLLPGGEEWRSGMNGSPVFAVATPQAFYEQAAALRADPATGKPDPASLQRFVAAHPETATFNAWARTAPWTTSYADQTYNSLNAFDLVDASGARHAVRWSMEPAAAETVATPAELAALGPDFLARDLKERVATGALHWRLVLVEAAPGDRTDDATIPWPADRKRLEVATLTVERVQDEADGPCRDVNYDPTVLPRGIGLSDDPLLPARSAAYANSFDRRSAETAQYPRGAAATEAHR